jgi:hypothetical protein
MTLWKLLERLTSTGYEARQKAIAPAGPKENDIRAKLARIGTGPGKTFTFKNLSLENNVEAPFGCDRDKEGVPFMPQTAPLRLGYRRGFGSTSDIVGVDDLLRGAFWRNWLVQLTRTYAKCQFWGLGSNGTENRLKE